MPYEVVMTSEAGEDTILERNIPRRKEARTLAVGYRFAFRPWGSPPVRYRYVAGKRRGRRKAWRRRK
jgi:hypothetical protein